MASFSGCRICVGFDDGRPDFEDEDSDLQLADGQLLISYWDERGVVVLVGREVEPGLFQLVARSRPRRCTLRREGSRTLIGTWVEGEEAGVLRVEIPAAGAAQLEENR